ncbi:uncharacterized protein K02A2.6-like [Patiria miniata]|uniref:Integrase zinc-binding domain-containing protein n=1 Tax=Patiria miniata TaxID=46514 RepID=A0A914BFF7_PATMI|nr:uncharacterized protein K02A2.6-like [Patiria miniata]
MLLKLQKYQVDVRYRKGTELVVAHALSRNFPPYIPDPKDDNCEIPVCMITCLPMSAERISELQRETANEPVMQQLAATIREGWPDLKSQVSANLAPYWDFREQLTLEEDLIFKNDKVIIPASLTKLMLTKVHQSHQGIEKTKRLARDIMFWPNMSAQITDMVSRCPICSANQHKNRKEPMIPHELPLRPWQKVGSDLFEI